MPSTIISANDYKAIAGYYGSIKTLLGNVTGYLYSAVTRIALVNDVEPTFDLMTDFYNSYSVNSVQITSTVPLLGAVRKLNSHVLNRGGYSSIGATGDAASFLSVQGITVPQSWADLSAATGQTIDASHILGT